MMSRCQLLCACCSNREGHPRQSHTKLGVAAFPTEKNIKPISICSTHLQRHCLRACGEFGQNDIMLFSYVVFLCFLVFSAMFLCVLVVSYVLCCFLECSCVFFVFLVFFVCFLVFYLVFLLCVMFYVVLLCFHLFSCVF